MKKATYKKVDERIEYVTIHHDETTDEQGNVVEAYDEVIERVVPIMAVVYEEMTREEIDALKEIEVEEVEQQETSADKRIEELESTVDELKKLIEQLTQK